MSLLSGFTIARAIPLEVLDGLAVGRYVLSGGVIRGAPGTAIGGQIVRHLLPASTNVLGAALSPVLSPVNAVLNMSQVAQLRGLSGNVAKLSASQSAGFNAVTLRMAHLSKDVGALTTNVDALTGVTKQVLGIATTTMAMSGLNLALSASGFVFLNRKLNKLNKKVDEISLNVRDVKMFLELTERAQLESALRDLAHAVTTPHYQNKRDLLLHARRTLSPIYLKYASLYKDYNQNAQRSIAEVLVCEEYFSVALLASVHSAAELDMTDVAYRDLDDGYTTWKEQTQKFVRERLFVDQPERYLYSEYTDSVSSNDLASWLNFVNPPRSTEEWIDKLRERLPQSRHMKLFATQRPFKESVDEEKIVPALHKMVHRDSVLSGYLSQYDVMKEHNLQPSALQRRLEKLPERDLLEGYAILEPEMPVEPELTEETAQEAERRFRWF
jgi:hypothetical protein